MSARASSGAPSLAAHVADTTHGIGRPRAYRRRRRSAALLRIALAVTALAAIAARFV